MSMSMNRNMKRLYEDAVVVVSEELREWNKTWVLGSPRFDYEKRLYEIFGMMVVEESVDQMEWSFAGGKYSDGHESTWSGTLEQFAAWNGGIKCARDHVRNHFG